VRNWSGDLKIDIHKRANGDTDLEEYLRANIDSVKQLLRGIGPDDALPSDGAGARIVFNMSCKHVAAFCQPGVSAVSNGYKNAYDLGKAGHKRQLVDDGIEQACKSRGVPVKKEKLYFGAVETTGTGIRFFGDMCLVLQFRPNWRTDDDPSDAGHSGDEQMTQVLDRNSYDLVRAPIAARAISKSTPPAKILGDWMGSWQTDLLEMIAMRVLQELPIAKRRWTGGEIARAILDDEDYCEVLFPCSFNAQQLTEVRLGASDAAAESDIADRERTGESPGIHELEWRQQRRDARCALARAGIPVRVVTSSGRMKGG
jgi:hypothetical protein